MKKVIAILFLIIPCFLCAKEFIPDKIHKDTIPIYNFGTLWAKGKVIFSGDTNNLNWNYPIPTQIGKTYNWLKLSPGSYIKIGSTFLALKSDSTLWTWGVNSSGQLGDSNKKYSLLPINILNKKKWIDIKSIYLSSYALSTDGLIWSWGDNKFGQLGDSTLISTTVPKPICKSESIPFISLGEMYDHGENYKFYSDLHSPIFAIRADGTIWGWGSLKSYSDTNSTLKYSYPKKVGNSNFWAEIIGYKNNIGNYQHGFYGFYITNKTGKISLINANHDVHSQNQWFEIEDSGFRDRDWKKIVSTDDFIIGLKYNKSIWSWGIRFPDEVDENGKKIFDSIPQQIGKDADWVDFSVAGKALKDDGTVWQLKQSKKWDYYKKDSVNYLNFEKINSINNVIHMKEVLYGNGTVFIVRHIPTQPEVQINELTQLTDTMAIFRAEVLSDGKEYDAVRGICYSLKPNPTIEDDTARHGTGMGEYFGIITKLTPKTQYYCRAFITNSLGTAYSDEFIIYTKLNKPILISPSNNSINQPLNIALEWKNVSDAKSYRIVIADNEDLIEPFADIVTDEVICKDINFQHLTEYYWKVQAWSDLDSSDWSETWSFSTSKYIVQKLEFPKNDTINIPIDCKLKWDLNIPLSKYNLQIADNSTFKDTYIDTLLNENFLDCKKLKFLQLYFWRVRAIEGNDKSDWSETWKFTTLMDSVKLVSPTNSEINTAVKSDFAWEQGIYRRNYRFQISSSLDFDFIDIDRLINNPSTEIENLNFYNTYNWRVRNESGDTLGYWSPIWNFQTVTSGIYLIYPKNHRTDIAPNVDFLWSEVLGASFYHLQVSKNIKFSDLVYSKDSLIKSTEIVKNLEYNTDYFWRVRAWNSIGNQTSNWSDIWKFTTGTSFVDETSEKIQILPNPIKPKGSICIKFNNVINKQEIKISIVDLSGKLIDETSSYISNINLQYEPETTLIPGTYFLVISSNGELLGREKFVVVE